MANDGTTMIPDATAPAASPLDNPALAVIASQLVQLCQSSIVGQNNWITEQKVLDGKFLLRRHSVANVVEG